MIKTVKLDKKNYFKDSLTGNKIYRYDPANNNLSLILTLDDESILTVDSSQIRQIFGGQVIVQHNNDRYIIDDGYQNVLIKAGYIVFENYDIEHQPDKNIGIQLRSKIIDRIRMIADHISVKYNKDCGINNMKYNGSETTIYIGTEEDDFSYTIRFDTINNIVNKNQIRKTNSLPFYPFDKEMDKYGTIYVSVFAKKNTRLDAESGNQKYKIADGIIEEIVSLLGQLFHYISLPIKQKVLFYKGI